MCPSVSRRQRKMMGAELGRKRAGKPTQTDMSETQLEDYAKGAGQKPRAKKKK